MRVPVMMLLQYWWSRLTVLWWHPVRDRSAEYQALIDLAARKARHRMAHSLAHARIAAA
jgi:hypothetical protein